MKIARFVGETLKEHAALVKAGINPKQALDIVYSPMKVEYLEECLNRLTVNQMDWLVKVLKDKLYFFEDRKSVYMICGIVKEATGYKVVFTDCAFQIDSIEVIQDELTEQQQEDIVSAIRQVL